MATDRVRPSLEAGLVSELQEVARPELAVPPESASIPATLRAVLRRVEQLEEERDELKALIERDGSDDLLSDMALLYQGLDTLQHAVTPHNKEVMWYQSRSGERKDYSRIPSPLEEVEVPADAPQFRRLEVKVPEGEPTRYAFSGSTVSKRERRPQVYRESRG